MTMESLSDTTWDVLIAGTGLAQALLALSLSRSDKKILHVDKNEYYGGFDAAFSLREAEEWAEKVNNSHRFAKFQNAQIRHSTSGPDGIPSKILGQSRKYTLSLSPQLIYAQSKLLPALVSSRVHTQLEFQAVGSWWVHSDKKLHRIPSGREDVFADDTLSRRDKITLMKFLRSVVNEGKAEELTQTAEVPQHDDDRYLAPLLHSQFKVSEVLHQPLLALSLSPLSSQSTKSSYALPRIKRHMTSIGAFGPGFGAVLPKYGGNAEIAQVGCRAGAVGGGVYILGAGIEGQEPADDPEHIQILLSNGEKVTTTYVVGNVDDVIRTDYAADEANFNQTLARSVHCISIVSSPLKQLFPPISESGPIPAGAIVLVDDKDHPEATPVYLQVHSEDTGECPGGQCVIYGCTLLTNNSDESKAREHVRQAAEQVVQACDETATILWEMNYTSQSLSIDCPPTPASLASDPYGHILAFPIQRHDIAFDDDLLDAVQAAWEKIMGPVAEGVEFMRFEERSEDLDEE